MPKASGVIPGQKEWIDWLRGLSAIAVGFYHFCQARDRPNGWYEHYAGFGYLGVTVFFVVSGYCIFLAAENSNSWKQFLVRRIFRIYPPYIFSLVIIGLIIGQRMYSIGVNDIVAAPQSVTAAILTLFAMVYPLTDVPAINWVYWTLVYEIAFYAVVAICLFKREFFVPLLLLVTGLSIFAQTDLLKDIFFLDQWALFALGLSIALVTKERSPINISFFICALIALTQFQFQDNKSDAIKMTAIITVILFLSFLYIEKRFTLPNLGPLSWAGRISYSLYLLHIPIGIYLIRDFEYFGVDLVKNPNIAVYVDVVKMIICLGAAHLTYKLVELPAINFGKRLSAKLAKPL